MSDGWRHQIVEMAAESMEYPRPDEALCTKECEKVWDHFDEAAYEALQRWVDIHPGELVRGEDVDSLWDDEGPYLIYMTLAGHGVGIWDGRWDEHFKDDSVIDKSLSPYLEDQLSREYQDLEFAIHEAAYDTAGGDKGEVEFSKEGVMGLASALSERLEASKPKYLGEWRWGQKNLSAYFITFSPEYGQALVVLVSVFDDGDVALDFFNNENMSELDRYENIGHQLWEGENLEDMESEVREVLETVDEYAESWQG